MTFSEAAARAETAAKRLSDVAVCLQNVANDLNVAASRNDANVTMAALHAFKRAQRAANDAMCGVNDAEMNLFTAK
jgi:hypothetical protein